MVGGEIQGEEPHFLSQLASRSMHQLDRRVNSASGTYNEGTILGAETQRKTFHENLILSIILIDFGVS